MFGEKPQVQFTPFRVLPVMSAMKFQAKPSNSGKLWVGNVISQTPLEHEASKAGCAIIPVLGQTSSIQAAAAGAETVPAFYYAILFRLPA